MRRFLVPIFLVVGCNVSTGDGDDGAGGDGASAGMAAGGGAGSAGVGGTSGQGGAGGAPADLADVSLEDFLSTSTKLEPPPSSNETLVCNDCPDPIANRQGGEHSCSFSLSRETETASNELVMLGPDDDLFPGNVLDGLDASMGEITRVPVDLGSATLSTTLVGGTQSVQVEALTPSAFQAAFDQLLDGHDKPSGTSVGSQLIVESILSEEDLSRTLSVSIGTPSISPIGGKLGLEQRSTEIVQHARVAVSFVQSYFKVSMDPPSMPQDHFAPSVSSQELGDALGPDSPAVYVRSVTYGRRVVALFEQVEQTWGDDLKSTVEGSYGGVEGKAGFDIATTTSMTKVKMRAVVLGDDKVLQSIDELNAYLMEPPDVQTAWPIAYTLHYVSDDSAFETGVTTEVISRTCMSCGGEDPSETGNEGFMSPFDYDMNPLGDNDSNRWKLNDLVLLSSDDEDWFRFDGEDTIGGVVDPQVKIISDNPDIEVCLYAQCLSGTLQYTCESGETASKGTLEGCCNTGSDAWLTGVSGTLCAGGGDDATIYVSVSGSALDTTCVSYDLDMHY